LRNTLAIATKEVRTYFASPIAYIIMAAFLFATGFFFVSSLSGAFREASVRGFLSAGAFVLLILGPVLTMRLIAEETKIGTIELLLTAPVRDYEVIVGKYLAALAILIAMLALTLYYPLMLFVFASPDPGPIFTGYIGILLVGSAFLSVGLFASTLSANQIVSAVTGLIVLLIFWFLANAAEFLGGVSATLLNYLSPQSHLNDFNRGVIDTGSIIYYVTVIAVFLFLAIRSLETRRWR